MSTYWSLVRVYVIDVLNPSSISRMFAGFVEPILLHLVGTQFQSIKTKIERDRLLSINTIYIKSDLKNNE